MVPSSRPRRRRWLLMGDTAGGDDPDSSAAAPPSIASADPLERQLAGDCGVDGGLEVQVARAGETEWLRQIVPGAFAIIGRDDACDIALGESDVSPRHLYLQALGGQIHFADLGSRSGTARGGRTCLTGVLGPDDTLVVGDCQVRAGLVNDGQKSSPSLPVDVAEGGALPIALEFSNPVRAVHPWTVDRPVTLIGAAPPSRVRLDHASVGPVHCVLIRGMRSWWVMDLGSGKETRVDGLAQRLAPISGGSVLEVGGYRISVRGASVEGPSPSPTADSRPSVPFPPTAGIGDDRVAVLLLEIARRHERMSSQFQLWCCQLLDDAVNPPAGSQSPPVDPDQPILESFDPPEREAALAWLAIQLRTLEARSSGAQLQLVRGLLRRLAHFRRL